MTKKKTSQSNIKSFNVKKDPVLPKPDFSEHKRGCLEEYQDFFTKRMQPVTESFLERIGCELIAYCEDPEIEYLRLDAFFIKKRICPETGKEWAKKYESFGRVYNACKKILGIRREDGAMRRGWNATVVMGTMGMFDDEYRSLKEWENKVKNDMLNSGTKMVLVESYFKPEEKKNEKQGDGS